MNTETNGLRQSNKQLWHVRTALSDLIEESPYMAHLKDAQTGQFIQGNRLWLENMGLDSGDAIYGLTVDDLTAEDGLYTKWNFSPAYMLWKNALSEATKKLEQRVKSTKRRATQLCVGFTSEGLMIIGSLTKLPVFSSDHKNVIAILTYGKNLAAQYNLPDLLSLYQHYYPKEQAIQKAFMHAEIDGYFNAWPSLDEAKVLFSLYQDADLFDQAVGSSIDRIKEKLRNRPAKLAFTHKWEKRSESRFEAGLNAAAPRHMTVWPGGGWQRRAR